jgi:anti-sigma factor RsiW
MIPCLDDEALLGIGHALEWGIGEGLSHLQTCAQCRTQLEMLQRIREEMLASESLDPAALHEITAAVRQAGREERFAARRRAPLWQAGEAFAAGVTGLIAVNSSGVPIEGPTVAAVAFSLAAILMIAGSTLARRLSTLRPIGASA